MDSSVAHFLAGGVGGTVGAIITCPLEVVKIRLQSSRNVLFTTPLPVSTPLDAASTNVSATPTNKAPPSNIVTTLPPQVSKQTNNTACVKPLSSTSSVSASSSVFRASTSPSPLSGPPRPQQLSAVQERCSPRILSSPQCHLSSPPHGATTTAKSTPSEGSNSHSPPAGAEEKAKFRRSMPIFTCMRRIVQQEGIPALFKGIGPTLVGVLPSRATYFYTYHKAQVYFSDSFPRWESPMLTIASASVGGLVSSTLTSPIWYVKTRLQLDTRSTSALTVIRETYGRYGLKGFFRGLQASYFGISETAVNFLLYESIKGYLLDWEHERLGSGSLSSSSNDRVPPNTKLHKYSDMFLCMFASACSKSMSITLLYPHEVARTRLREDGDRYRRFVQTLVLVVREEGVRGLYRGLVTHYARQIPNSCITIGVYEMVVYLLNDWDLVAQRE